MWAAYFYENNNQHTYTFLSLKLSSQFESNESILRNFSNFQMLGSARRGAEGHGRLMDPPARNSMWRFGFPNPVNYNDNELFCGGYAGQNSCYLQSVHNVSIFGSLVPNSRGRNGNFITKTLMSFLVQQGYIFIEPQLWVKLKKEECYVKT